MIAHSRQSLDNRDIQQEALKALAKGALTGDEYQRIREAYPYKLYSPNIFIRIGLFLLAVLAIACGLGLSMLIGNGEGGFLIFWGLICYGSLELFIYNRGVYRAGVDDALLLMAGVLIFIGVGWLAPRITGSQASSLVLLLATWGMLRYTDRLMTIVAYGALMSLIFCLITDQIHLSTNTIPFIFMAVSAIAYIVFTGQAANESIRHYRECLSVLRAAALLTFYLSGNYYIVHQVSAEIHGESAHVALGWLWWTFTSIVPIAYIVWGIRKKDTILLGMGLPLVAASIFTVRYYYHVMPAELAMIIAGTILLIGAYALTRYLRIPKNGFTSAAPDEHHLLQDLPVEGLILAETFKGVASQPVDQPGHFGGGSGGGGGAGGTY